MLGQSIQRLRFCQSLCPCFVSEQEHAMWVADMVIQSVPIRWYRKIRISPYGTGSSTILGATNDLFSHLCGKLEDDQIPKSVRLSGSEATITQYVGIEATMTVIGTSEGPALKIVSNNCFFVDNDDMELEENSSLHMSKTILFKNMSLATPGKAYDWEDIGFSGENGLMIVAKVGPKEIEPPAYKRIFTCCLLPDSKLSLSRPEAVRHLNNLISWDKDGPLKEEINSYDIQAIVKSRVRYVRLEEGSHQEIEVIEVD
mmetsp:Transcript_33878/g.38540  ORF Transcript_33878/g.38540 Transcript_33878/m.38540 type:complete len:257 (-) Transcript_33878:187-957(-)